MATARVALGSVLGTVTDTAQTISTVINTVGSSVEMLANYVNNAREEQEINLLLGKEDRETQILERISLDTAKRHIETEEFFQKNPSVQDVYKETYKDLQNKLTAFKATRNPNLLKTI